MSVDDLSPSMQNYLKVIWGLQEWSDAPVSNSAIAESAGVRLSTVSDALRKLSDLELIGHARYGSVTLTDAGREHAVSMIRRHRLLETYLVQALGYEWDEVHAEADRLEHAVSDGLIDRVDRALGYPTRDPHGDPIPSADGRVHRPDAVILASVTAPCRVRVERISDSDTAMLQYFASRGLVVDAELEVLPGEPYSETVTVRIGGGAEPVSLGAAAAASVWVAGAGSDAAAGSDTAS
ncbi:metal-dependent transcriptional regulator [Leucobacter luti]|uniref:Manganese transport regulator n=1 Tax=Leucobacter luti TaxID=340320 RepID=A0A4Q7TXU0_9MICO|nr:metal-dependent transcriptional regulator [Leucobacter luti]MBL3698370.1 metal-dependent transcriptional regulator [Leucobacter luti]RZT64542.1 DtxR family iron (metal) dependent repressor [Leucobacter luti]